MNVEVWLQTILKFITVDTVSNSGKFLNVMRYSYSNSYANSAILTIQVMIVLPLGFVLLGVCWHVYSFEYKGAHNVPIIPNTGPLGASNCRSGARALAPSLLLQASDLADWWEQVI